MDFRRFGYGIAAGSAFLLFLLPVATYAGIQTPCPDMKPDNYTSGCKKPNTHYDVRFVSMGSCPQPVVTERKINPAFMDGDPRATAIPSEILYCITGCTLIKCADNPKPETLPFDENTPMSQNEGGNELGGFSSQTKWASLQSNTTMTDAPAFTQYTPQPNPAPSTLDISNSGTSDGLQTSGMYEQVQTSGQTTGFSNSSAGVSSDPGASQVAQTDVMSESVWDPKNFVLQPAHNYSAEFGTRVAGQTTGFTTSSMGATEALSQPGFIQTAFSKIQQWLVHPI